MSLLDVIREDEAYNAKAKAESLSHPCDLCHVSEGESFTDYYWLCGNCSESYLARILAEGYGKPDVIIAVILAAMAISEAA